jgi:lipopolysaccharide export system permease protein
MQILTSYIGKTVITTILLVVVVLVGLEIFVELSRQFTDIGTGYYGFLQALAFVPLLLPLDTYQFFPMAGLLGSIIGIGLLASHSELIIMQASGMSVLRIGISLMKAALVITLVMLLVGEIVAPIAQRAANNNKATAMTSGQTFLTRQGVWVRSNNNYLQIDKVIGDGVLEGITCYKFNDHQKLLVASFAAKGIYKNGKWVFTNIKQTAFVNNKIVSSHIASAEWNVTLNPKLIGLSYDSEQKSLPELYSYIKYRQQSGLATDHYEFIMWQRIFQPLATLVMIVLAVPFVFGPLRSRTTGFRMLVGVLVGFGFYILNQFVGSLSLVYQVPPVLAAIIPTLVFATLGIVLLAKAK